MNMNNYKMMKRMKVKLERVLYKIGEVYWNRPERVQ